MPEFRGGILAVDCSDEEDKADSLVYQTQTMFAYLQESEKQAYNPKGFCFALKVPLLCRSWVIAAPLVSVDVLCRDSERVAVMSCCWSGACVHWRCGAPCDCCKV